MPRHAAYRMTSLVPVEKATHEPVIVGDFVRLASGSPLGLIVSCQDNEAEVVWLTGDGQRSVLPAVCLRPINPSA